MQRQKQPVPLTESERTTRQDLRTQGARAAKRVNRAIVLRALDRGKTLAAVAATRDLPSLTVAAWRASAPAAGLQGLHDAPRSGRPSGIDGTKRATITALACSDAPAGSAHWSLRLLAENAVERELGAAIAQTTVGDILKKRPETARGADLVDRHTRRALAGAA